MTRNSTQTATRRAGSNNARRVSRFSPGTVNAEERSVWVVAATETPVRRYMGEEVLRCDPASVVASRMNGMPLLDSHDRSSVLSVLGQVVETKFEGRTLLAKIVFADNERGDGAFKLVQSGMLNKVSVGYRIHEADETRGRGGDVTVTATRWEPFELSLVSVPADPNATIRGNTTMPNQTAFDDDNDQIDENANELNDNDNGGQRTSPNVFTRHLQQVSGIRRTAIEGGVSERQFDDATRNCASIDDVRRVALDLLVNRSIATRADAYNPLSTTDIIRGVGSNNAVIDALAIRLGATGISQNNPLAGRSVIEIGRAWMAQNHIAMRDANDAQIADCLFSGDERIFSRSFGGVGMHTTSDFPALFLEAGNRALMERFNALVSPLKALSTKRNARDFRARKFVRPGEAPKLEKISESGEITFGTMEMEESGLKIESYARGFSISRQALINDDLGAMADFLSAFADMATETEADEFFNLLSANSFAGIRLSDGETLFHASHNNRASVGAALSIETLSAARERMRLHRNVNGTGNAGAVPAVLVVGPRLETEAEKLVAQINATNVDGVNPFGGKLRIAVENRYEGLGWWLFADPSRRPAFTHGYLEGFPEGPRTSQDEVKGRQGLVFTCEMDFGCAVYDWRAAYFNPGVPE